MGRAQRIFVPGLPMHVVQRGNNRQLIFVDDIDRERYRDFLVIVSERLRCAIHCYALMGNHVHLLVTPGAEGALPAFMQALGVRYVRYFNTRYRRTGGLWDGRYKAELVETDRYLNACFRYIESNPVRAGLVQRPEQYPWSSYRCHALGWPDRVVSLHRFYLAMGDTASARQRRYRELLVSDTV